MESVLGLPKTGVFNQIADHLVRSFHLFIYFLTFYSLIATSNILLDLLVDVYAISTKQITNCTYRKVYNKFKPVINIYSCLVFLKTQLNSTVSGQFLYSSLVENINILNTITIIFQLIRS